MPIVVPYHALTVSLYAVPFETEVKRGEDGMNPYREGPSETVFSKPNAALFLVFIGLIIGLCVGFVAKVFALV